MRGGTDLASDNFWDTTSSGTATGVGSGSATGIAGKTTTELRTFSTYTASSWAITNGWTAFAPPASVWGICAGTTRAFLLWQYVSTPCVTAPGAPTITSVAPGLTSAQVAFTADDSGGATITRLEFALDDTLAVDDSTTSLASPHLLAGLTSSTTYAVYLRAVNAQGTGPWSSPTVFTTLTPSPPPPPPSPATAPRDVVATAGQGSVTAAWQAPVSQGSYPVTHYKATASPGGGTCLTASTMCTIEGLTPGVTYTVTVEALSGAGWSPSSAPSNAVVPRPSIVPSLTITGSRGSGAERSLIRVRGTSTGLAGERATLWLSMGGRPATPASASVTIRADGTFTWSRRAAREVRIYAQVGITRSNTITIPAAR